MWYDKKAATHTSALNRVPQLLSLLRTCYRHLRTSRARKHSCLTTLGTCAIESLEHIVGTNFSWSLPMRNLCLSCVQTTELKVRFVVGLDEAREEAFVAVAEGWETPWLVQRKILPYLDEGCKMWRMIGGLTVHMMKSIITKGAMSSNERTHHFQLGWHFTFQLKKFYL